MRAPRASSSDQVTPLPHSGWACVHLRLDLHAAGDRAAPADGRLQVGRRMDADAVRLHVARDADVPVGRVGDEQRSASRWSPALDEVVADRAGRSGVVAAIRRTGSPPARCRGSRATPPSTSGSTVVPAGQVGDVGLVLAAAPPPGGGQAIRRGGEGCRRRASMSFR